MSAASDRLDPSRKEPSRVGTTRTITPLPHGCRADRHRFHHDGLGPLGRPGGPGSPALTPPLGWNSWNSFGCGVTEAQVRQAADAMVSSGMRDAGYRYVVVDDCWFDPQRDTAGNLRANPTKFPSGMKALGTTSTGKA
ncbi:hypothetical protein SVIO_005120 [Streptomyces violaceusniger]|uniref:Alpha-galactosidase n=1 Tax=Streptomyces violaceusniger TaxID=68280 RepID=A0A4D4KVM1_STRVO|nr:hypothetical protein SVIO_005120 [Streptomyces violaceusniger]